MMRVNNKKFAVFKGYGVAAARVFLIRLCTGGKLYHVLFIDLWNGIIFDNESEYPLSLCV